ncbi:unnamed protein product [Rhizopus microsporus]
MKHATWKPAIWKLSALEAFSANRSYQSGQDLFLIWAADNKVSPTHFSPIDLINFLSDMYISKPYAISTRICILDTQYTFLCFHAYEWKHCLSLCSVPSYEDACPLHRESF